MNVNRTVLGGLAVALTIACFHTFAGFMVGEAGDAEISDEYYYSSGQDDEAEAFTEPVFNEYNDIGFEAEAAEMPEEPVKEETQPAGIGVEEAAVNENEYDSVSEIADEPGFYAVGGTSEDRSLEIPEPETADEPETVQETAPAPEPEPADETKPAPKPEPVQKTKPAPEPKPAHEAEPASKSEPDEEEYPEDNRELTEVKEDLKEEEEDVKEDYMIDDVPPVPAGEYVGSFSKKTQGGQSIAPSGVNDAQTPPVTFSNIIPPADEMFSVSYGGSEKTVNSYDLVCAIVNKEISAGSYGDEAIKAQAVAAYSYLKYHKSKGLVPSVVVKYEDMPEKIRKLVSEVWGVACYYGGETAQTVYMASSSGHTASAENVWGGSVVPYLVSVSCPFDEYDVNYGVSVWFSEDDIRNSVEKSLNIVLSPDPSNWFRIEGYIDGNYVGRLNIDGQTSVTGRKMRETVLGFRIKSASFNVTYSEGKFIFTTYGYGHGVGMSQTGANYLAKNMGYSYIDILKHYYTGIEVY